ncbi:MAG TPA: transglycosylase SLT domain-containing protein [Gemmatimonadaceae bacterium]|jgi:hypothetical protein|nr:transglycosylase SLT domain-containing protein [Gemmatimonadaceae bacterium]
MLETFVARPSKIGLRVVADWKARVTPIGRMAAWALVFVGSVIYTVEQAHPRFDQPGVVLPAMVIRAPLFSLEASRVAAVLKQHTKDTTTADRIAGMIVEQGKRHNIDPALLVGVLLTENETLDTMARSMVGARGLMQVMPEHSGKWGCGSSNLFAVESNICHGASILQDVMRTAPNVRVALLRYNGCVRGSNTPDCHAYPGRVLRLANHTTDQMLAFAE